MTSIAVYRGPTELIAGIIAQGHAGKRSAPENDIVCSAVSALTQTAVNALEQVAGIVTQPRVGDGFLSVFLPEGLTQAQEHDGQIIMRTVVQGLTDIASSYPSQVRVVWKEWRKSHASNEFDAVRS